MDEDAICAEANVTCTLHAAGLPVPRVDDVVILDGRRGIVYERFDGELLAHRLCREPWLDRLHSMMAVG